MHVTVNNTKSIYHVYFFFSSRRRHTRFDCDWSSDVCSSDLIQADRERVHAREGLEDHGVAFHDRQRGMGAAVAQAEDLRAVRDDRDGVAPAGVFERGDRVLVDGQAGLGHAGGVDEAQDRLVPDRHLALDADDAAGALAGVQLIVRHTMLAYILLRSFNFAKRCLMASTLCSSAPDADCRYSSYWAIASSTRPAPSSARPRPACASMAPGARWSAS